MKKTKLTRSLLAACSIVALSAVMYGCSHSGDDPVEPVVEQPDPDAEAMALATAQSAAMDAWLAARDAVASIANTDAEPVAQQLAMNALTDARAAYDAAMAATTSAEAMRHQAAAEAARDMATAQVATVVAARDAGAIMAAGMAAAQSAQAAKISYDAAKMAVANVEAFKALDMDSYDMAMAQVTAAKMAYDAAMAASTAAAAATLLGDAAAQQTAAATAMGNAAAANTAAMKYAGMVQTAEDNALTAARGAADTAYMAAKMTAGEARQAAGDASAEADAAEAANVGSPAAKDSRTAADAAATAATAAEAAATAAGTAKMAADDAATSAGAKGHQATAEGKRDEAQGHLATAQMKLADAEASTIIAQNTGAGTLLIWQQRADDANQEAAGYATAARAAADKADAQADAAEADATRAMRARTDHANANEKAVAARTAANAAEAAATAAETAATTASDALALATADDATTAVAREQSNIARTAAMGAAGEPAKANTGYMNAMEAAGEAKMYANTHVLGLFKAANAVGVMDADDRADAIKAMAATIGSAAGDQGLGTIGAAWPANTPANPDADPPTDEVVMPLTVTITDVGTDDIVSETRASDPDADPAIVNNAKSITGVPGFMHGFDITDGAVEADDRHAIVFTDIEQEEAAVPVVNLDKAVIINNKPVVASRVVITEDADDLMGALYDHDGDPDTNGLTATYTCGSAQATDCSYEIEGGKVTSLAGYVVSVSIDASTAASFILTAAKDAVPDTSFLAFGVWLNEADSDDQTDGDQPSFGAFAGGGARLGDVDLIAVTGTAKYNGAATGVYTAGESVDYFYGDASLTATFGPAAADDTVTPAITAADAQGSISGTISGIVAGGTSMSDVINLNAAALDTNASQGFNGNARMGAATVKDDVATYKYNGSWGGHFYNQAMNDEDTDADESVTTAPGSVAGTFGVTGSDGGDDDPTRSYVGAFGAHE